MKTILCYGDSNTHGYNPSDGERYPREVRWTGRLQELLGKDYYVIEEGCNGRTTMREDPFDPWKNGMPYLKPCLNSHKPVDIVILMLGSNDLKDYFHASAKDIADGAAALIEVIQSFTEEKQGFIPQIILMSPPEIGEGIAASPFGDRFKEDAITRSKEFPKYYKTVAEKYGCIFLDTAEYIKPSELDCLHLSAESHTILAEKVAANINDNNL